MQISCPIVVGREDELAILEQAMDEARSGSGALFVVSGEPGIGKSRLTRELIGRARRRGMAVAAGRAIEATSRIPFRPIGEAIQSLVRDVGAPADPDLAPFQAVLAPFVPQWERGEKPVPESGLVLLEGLLRLYSSLALDKGLVLVFEDLHWADSDSLGAIDYLAENIEAQAIVCVCTERSGDTSSTADALATLVARRAARRLALEPLPREQVAHMVRACLGVEAVPPALLDALRQRAEGVPFLIEEMLSAYSEAAETPTATAAWWMASHIGSHIPPSLHDLVQTRLESLPVEATEVIRAAAVLGRAFEWSLLVSITGRDEGFVLDALRQAVAQSLLVGTGWSDPDSFSFRHALMRESVLAQMLPPERARLSLAAAEAIEDERPGLPGEWCERAAALREQSGDAVGAVRLLQESARRALARGALATAEANLRRARELGRDDYTLWFGTDELLAEVLVRAGKIQELVTLTKDSIAALVDEDHPRWPSWRPWMRLQPRRLAELHLRVAHAAFLGPEPHEAMAHLARARSAAAHDRAIQVRTQVLAAAVAHASGDVESAVEEARAALVEAEALGMHKVGFDALETIGLAEGSRGDLARAEQTFVRLIGEAAGEGALPWRIRALEQLGAIRSVTRGDARMLEEARTLAIDCGAVSALASIELHIAWQRLSEGRREEAGPFIDRVVDAGRTFGLSLLPEALIARAAWWALNDDENQMQTEIDRALHEGGGRPDIEAAALGEARAVLCLIREDRATAGAALDRAASLSARWRWGPPWFLGLGELLRVIDAHVPKTDDSLVAHGHPGLAGFAAFTRSVSLGRRGDKEGATEAFVRADTLMPWNWRHHLARRLVAETAIADGWGDPGRWAQEELAFFEASGFPRIANACKRVMRAAGVAVPRMGRGGARVPGPLQALGVTSREMDVLLLVAEGLSNAEIAERLFLSPRTIETHVKSLMRRSETTTRAQLVAFAGRHAVVADTIGP